MFVGKEQALGNIQDLVVILHVLQVVSTFYNNGGDFMSRKSTAFPCHRQSIRIFLVTWKENMVLKSVLHPPDQLTWQSSYHSSSSAKIAITW